MGKRTHRSWLSIIATISLLATLAPVAAAQDMQQRSAPVDAASAARPAPSSSESTAIPDAIDECGGPDMGLLAVGSSPTLQPPCPGYPSPMTGTAGPSPASGDPASGTGDWSIVASQDRTGKTSNHLEAMTCVSQSDCWAVGYHHIPPADPYHPKQTLIEHWDGTNWTVVSSPNVGTGVDNVLRDVTCTSTGDCWAVGYYGSGWDELTLITRWDGTSWTIVTSPNDTDPKQSNRLSGVTCVSQSDCWAVGIANYTLILRWNGTSWERLPLSQIEFAAVGALNAVTCVSASDCWAVGSFVANSVDQTLIKRWDGTSWTNVTSPAPGVNGSLADVTCLSASHCWAVGSYVVDPQALQGSTVQTTIIDHWDGTSWTAVTAPPDLGFLSAVTCASAADCWAVGSRQNDLDGTSPLIQRWEGTSWSTVASPNGPRSGSLRGIRCSSPSECWAVGSSDDDALDQTLIQRWDETSWTTVPSPNVRAMQSNYVEDVTCASGSDCWAVGYHDDGVFHQTLIQHWDGTAWALVTSPNTSVDHDNYLYDVTCVSASDCWAVGAYRDGQSHATLTAHWDGISWAIVTSPARGQLSLLRSVTCASGSDCWAVGYYSPGITFQTLIQHWDGTEWTTVTSPNVSTTDINVLWRATCASASDCWAVGFTQKQDGTGGQTIIQRWDGTSWALVASPNGGSTYNWLADVTCTSAKDCWAVGFYHGAAGAQQTLIVRWDGSSWAIVASPDTTRPYESLLSVACASASRCWAAGYSYDGATVQTLIAGWDGTSWTFSASPNASVTRDNTLLGVACAPASDCWAVGAADADTPSDRRRALVMRYDSEIPTG